MTLFTSNRVKVIPFERHFEECEQDHGLKARFEQPENLSGILNWAIDGLHKLLAEGFATPGCIRQAIEAYRKSSDKIAQFVEECLIRGDDREVRTSEVYSRYQEWCQGNGYRAENQRNFKQMLATYGAVVRKRPNNGGGLTTMLTGYCLQREVEPL
jgi:putative DNA primase/helicase